MSIEYPETFGEAFWEPQVRATKQYADDEEKALEAYVHALVGLVPHVEGLSLDFLAPLQDFGTTGHFANAELGKQVLGSHVSSGIMSAFEPWLRGIGYAANKDRPNKLIDVDQIMTLGHRRKIIPDVFADRVGWNGFTADEAKMAYDASSPYPDTLSLLQWARYTTDDNATFTKFQSKMDISDEEFQIWDFMGRLRLNENHMHELVTRGYMTREQAVDELVRDGYQRFDAEAVIDLGYAIPSPALLLQTALLKGSSYAESAQQVTLGGIHPDYADAFIDGVLTRPDPTTIIRYLLRQDPSLGTLDNELRRIGVHPSYFDMYKELSYPVPPVSDLITMAVREAFSPQIAGAFGQYEDYPTDLTKYAAMNGLSEEWSRRYWAAHWNLPSPQQGFEMLHRGVIDEAQMNLLLRALDVMPFWRDKLMQISYNPLTRVDVRRMYSLGVLSESEVREAYQNAGYTRENADRLREFTVRQTSASQSGMSAGKIVTAYKNGFTNRQDAYNAISRLGIRPQTVSDIMESADTQLEWQRKKDGIASIKNRYKQEIINEGQARVELSSLRIDSTKIDNLINQWVADGEKEHGTLLSKTDVLTLTKKGLITQQRAKQELTLLGYTSERANLLLATIAES